MKYDREVDILYIQLNDLPIEDRPGMVVDYDINGQVVGIEIMNASKRMAKPTTVELEIA